jgi:hypothetical protein
LFLFVAYILYIYIFIDNHQQQQAYELRQQKWQNAIDEPTGRAMNGPGILWNHVFCYGMSVCSFYLPKL